MSTELIIIICYSILTPILVVNAFIVGFNMNGNKKIFARKPQEKELTEDEVMLQRIDSAKVYDEVI